MPGTVGVRSLEELVVYQLSVEFKRSIYGLVRRTAAAERDSRYRDQLFDAVLSVSANVAEGFARRSTNDFCLFLSYARGSAAEAITRLQDGVDRGYFTQAACEDALVLGRRTAAAIAGLQRSLRPFLNTTRRR
jgi:four helix bundle protein